jgi:hypothetical protein
LLATLARNGRPAFDDTPALGAAPALSALELPAARRSGGNARMFRFIPASRLGEQAGRARMILEQSCMRRDIVRAPKARPIGRRQTQRRNVEGASFALGLSTLIRLENAFIEIS